MLLSIEILLNQSIKITEKFFLNFKHPLLKPNKRSLIF